LLLKASRAKPFNQPPHLIRPLATIYTLNQQGHPLSYGFTSIVTVVLIGIRNSLKSRDPLDNGKHCPPSWHKTSKQH
jgi:hypothetical protein